MTQIYVFELFLQSVRYVDGEYLGNPQTLVTLLQRQGRIDDVLDYDPKYSTVYRTLDAALLFLGKVLKNVEKVTQIGDVMRDRGFYRERIQLTEEQVRQLLGGPEVAVNPGLTDFSPEFKMKLSHWATTQNSSDANKS